MQPRVFINLALGVFLAALVGLMFFGPGSSNDKSQHRITSLNKNDVDNITILRKSGDIILIKKDNVWFMQHPHHIRAHAFRINSLLNLVKLETTSLYNSDDLNLKTYGLDKPRAKIKFNNTLIEFGKTNPVNLKRYLKVGKNIFLVSDLLYPLISSQPTSFVNLALFSETDKIQKITLPEFTIYKDDEGTWKTRPENIASADDIQTLLQNWQLSKAFGVHAYLSRKKLGTIEIVLQNNKIVTFEITDNDPWLILYQADVGIEYHLDISNTDTLLSIKNRQ